MSLDRLNAVAGLVFEVPDLNFEFLNLVLVSRDIRGCRRTA